jgi:hypothetical protein
MYNFKVVIGTTVVSTCHSKYLQRRREDAKDVQNLWRFALVAILHLTLSQVLDYFNLFNASPNLEIISPISSFLHVPTLSLYHVDSRLAPNA